MYIADISIPIAFEAESDDQARLILAHLQDVLACVVLPHNGEVFDMPGVSLGESLPYQEFRSIVPGTVFLAEYAPVEPGASAGCETCADHEHSRNRELTAP